MTLQTHTRTRWLLTLIALLPFVALALEPFTGFDSPSSRATKLPATFNGWHFEDKEASSQGYMHLIHLKDGGWITLLFTAANMGPYHLSSSMAVMYAKPGEPVRICKDIWKDEESMSVPPKDQYKIRINNSTFGGKYPDFYAKVRDGGCTGDLTFKSIVPSYIQGSGVATFGSDKGGKWRLIAISPRAKVSGSITFKEGKVNVEGDAYLEEVATDQIVPSFADRWYIMHAVNGPYTINLFDIVLDKARFGDGHVKTLMVARDDQILMGTTQFNYAVQGTFADKESGLAVPKAFNLSARDGSTALNGTVAFGTKLHQLELLTNLPTLARLYAGVRYGHPYQFRSAVNYELALNENGVVTPIKGVGFQELHFYDR